MDLLQLRYFCYAAEVQNFAQTAKHFFVPASGISQSIKRLENELGIKLFDRTGNRILLNDAGKFFYEKTALALSALDEAKLGVQSKNAKEEALRVLVLSNRRVVTLAAERFSKAFPHTPLFFTYRQNESEAYDMIVADTSPTGAVYERLPLVTEPFALAVPEGHPLTEAPLHLEELEKERFVCMPKGSSLYEMLHTLCLSHGFSPTIALESDDPATVRHCIEEGVGIGLVPAFSWRGLFSRRVRLVPVADLFRTTYLFYRPEVLASPAKKAFTETLRSFFAEEAKPLSL